MSIEYQPDKINTPAPKWTKKRMNRGENNFEKLSNYICTRTPPYSYKSYTVIFINIVRRNQSVFGNWSKGYELLAEMVYNKLIQRDGKL